MAYTASSIGVFRFLCVLWRAVENLELLPNKAQYCFSKQNLEGIRYRKSINTLMRHS